MESTSSFSEVKELNAESLKEAEIEQKVIFDIFENYNKSIGLLQKEAEYFGNVLSLCKEVNSVKWRVKDPIHLLLKIVRKRKEALKSKEKIDYKREDFPYLTINVDNYKTIVNDLVGIRAIYLFKANWKAVDYYVLTNIKVDKTEKIKIYYAEDDDQSFYITSPDYEYKSEMKKSRYRSTHYIIKGNSPGGFKFEVQTRTILDEAWGEIDHHIRYPDFEDEVALKENMLTLNNLMSECEQLASTFLQNSNKLKIEAFKPNEISSDESTPNEISSDEAWDRAVKNIGNSREKERFIMSLCMSQDNDVNKSFEPTKSVHPWEGIYKSINQPIDLIKSFNKDKD